jgi:ubiquinone/menaquinone biosynthesis C-methylase UbiE
MIDFARSRLEKVRRELVGDVEFDTGDITQLDEPDGTYDKVVVTRVIINLSEWDLQQAGLRHASRLVKPGGLLLLSEVPLPMRRHMLGA